MTLEAKPSTRAIRAALETDSQHGAVVPPLHLSSTFAFERFGEKRQYDYSRSGNPTRDALADSICDLEGGAGAVVTASGMAAIHLVLQLVGPGDVVVAPHDCYGGTHRLLTNLADKGSFEVRFVDQTDSEAFAQTAKGASLLFVETPSNPLLRIVDLALASELATATGALLVVDNTFLSPALQQPLALGADLVVHSTTKYLNGHSDVVGGAVVAATPELAERVTWWANCIGCTGAPFDSFLTLRGIRTLHARMRHHEEGALLLANVLREHVGVNRVYYPGLPEHDGHELAKRQQSGFGGMLSFELAGGPEAVRNFVEGLEYFSLAESLGGIESLVCHPPSMTHAAVDSKTLADAGISDCLVRLSVGLEAPEDLVADVIAGLERALRVGSRPAAVACA